MMRRRRFILSAAAAAASAFADWPGAARALPRPPSLRRLRLANPHTGETFSGPYRGADGAPIAAAMRELSVFLRDFHCGATRRMDVGVLDFLADMLDAVGDGAATILSAYRTPQTNAMLARTTFGVAEHSQHMYGRALDVHVGRLADAMAAARAMRRGGVGWYPNSRFIHIDTGPVRNWNLGGGGLRDLLLFDGPLTITSAGELRFGGHGRRLFPARRPLSVAQRLALHRRLARAEYLARHHRR